MHGKLAVVAALLVLSHLEMFNARAIVKARTAGAEAEITGRKARHARFGSVGSLLVVALIALVVYGLR
jgi:hypothetical protein